MSVTYAEKVYCAVNGAERTGWGKQFGMGATPTLRLTRKPFLQMSAHESWAKYWLEMAARRRDLPEFESAEIIEVDSLTSSIESIWQGWSPVSQAGKGGGSPEGVLKNTTVWVARRFGQILY